MISSRAWLRTRARATWDSARASAQSGTWANHNELFNGILVLYPEEGSIAETSVR